VGTGCTAGTYTTNCISGGADSNCTNAGTTETNFGMNFSVPANFLIANKLLRVTMSYEWTTTSSPPSFRLRMKLNTTNVYDNSALALAGSMTSRGAGAAFLIQGTAAPGASVNVETAITSIGSRIIGLTTEGNTIAQPVAIATNAAQTLQFSLQLGTATAGNFVRLRQLIVEELN
jgi:hypothetical protein